MITEPEMYADGGRFYLLNDGEEEGPFTREEMILRCVHKNYVPGANFTYGAASRWYPFEQLFKYLPQLPDRVFVIEKKRVSVSRGIGGLCIIIAAICVISGFFNATSANEFYFFGGSITFLMIGLLLFIVSRLGDIRELLQKQK
ncbi:MAG: hypothetical protein M3Y82_06200 [Verrucomicrobiota bacterium]|nr:hypothetical protein [Verrucomicrobiota bacterium]